MKKTLFMLSGDHWSHALMWQMVNARNVVGRYDMAVVLKAQVDNLTGRNEELRRELHELRCEAAKAQENFNRANCKACLYIARVESYKLTDIQYSIVVCYGI